MAKDRAYKWGWHPDRPWDSHHFPVPPDGLLSTADTAKYVGLFGAKDVLACINGGWLPAFKDGGRWRIRIEDANKLRQRLVAAKVFCSDPPEDHRCLVTATLDTPAQRAALAKHFGREFRPTVNLWGCSSVERQPGRQVARLERVSENEVRLHYPDGSTAIETQLTRALSITESEKPPNDQ